jgi:hypothetical protein
MVSLSSKKLVPPTEKQEEIRVLQACAVAHAESKRLPGCKLFRARCTWFYSVIAGK